MTTKAQTLLPLPDPPEREPDDMTSVQHLGENGNLHRSDSCKWHRAKSPASDGHRQNCRNE